MNLLSSLYFYVCRYLSYFRLNKYLNKYTVYLTFDDGPEPGITESILDTLRQYNAKATFFCCGFNCDNHPELLRRIKDEGHVIANHTYSHIKGLSTKDFEYIMDVEKGCETTHSCVFRPPWAGATLLQYLKLKKHIFVYWDVVSGDTELEVFDLKRNVERLKKTDLNGKIVLFHFCNLHEKETIQILPEFMKIVSEQGLNCEGINI